MVVDSFRSEEMKFLSTFDPDEYGIIDAEWIAVQGSQLIAHAPTLRECLEISKKVGYPNPFITAVHAKKDRGTPISPSAWISNE